MQLWLLGFRREGARYSKIQGCRNHMRPVNTPVMFRSENKGPCAASVAAVLSLVGLLGRVQFIKKRYPGTCNTRAKTTRGAAREQHMATSPA